MKRFLQVLMLVAALCVPWAMNAQQTLTVHDGTTTNGYVPIYGYYADAYLKCQMVYPASELSAMSGKTITGLTFYQSSSTSWTSTQFQVYMKEVTSTTISAYDDLTGASLVYSGPLSGSNANLAITFSSDYTYNGGNLLVAVYNATTGTYNSCNFYGETATGSSVQGYSYSSLSGVSVTQRNFLPKTTFAYENPASCVKPTGVTASNISATGATISWTPGAATQSTFKVAYGTGTDPTSMDSVTVTSTSTTLTGLNPNTVYNVYVKAVCSATDQSNWSSVGTFRTQCAAVSPASLGTISFETSEGFVTGSGNMANCWTVGNLQSTSTSYQPYIYNYSSYAHTGTNSLRMYAYKSSSTNADSAYAVMPALTYTGGIATYEAHFYLRRISTSSSSSYSYNDTLFVGVVSDPADMSDLQIVGYGVNSTTTYAQQIVSLSSYTGGTTGYIVFLAACNLNATASYKSASFYVDDIKIIKSRATSTPVVDSIFNITTTTAQVAFSGSNATSYRIMAATESVSDPDTYANWAIDTLVTSSPATINVQSGTQYNLYVQGIGTDTSFIGNATAFMTACEAYAIPYTCGFEAVEGFTQTNTWVDGMLESHCWQTLGMRTSGSYPYYNIATTTYLHNGSQGLKGFSASSSYAYLTLPVFSEPTDSLQLEFWYRNEGTSSSSPYVEIGYMTNPADNTTFVMLQQLVKTTTMTQATQSFAGLNVPSTARISIRFGGASSSNYYCGIDDIKVVKLRATATPVIDSVFNITATTAQVAFSGSNATSYRIMAATESVSDPDTYANWAIDTLVTSSPATLNVQHSTNYYLYMQGIGTDTSLISSPAVTFQSECSAVSTFPWSEDFDSYTTAGNFSAACWTNEHVSGSGSQVFKIYTYSMGGNTTPKLQLPDMSSGTITHLLLPNMNFTAANSYRFTISVYRSVSGSSYTTEGIRIYATPDGTVANATEMAFISRNYTVSDSLISAESAAGWYTYELPIPIAAGQILIQGESRYGSSTYMDDFMVDRIPTCINPVNVAVSNLSATSATISWTPRDTTQNNFVVAYGTGTDPTSMDSVTVTTTSTALTGLTPATSYNVYVKAVCSATDHSIWSPVATFTTTAIPATAPYMCSFDDSTDNAAWLTVAGSGVNHFMIGSDINARYTDSSSLYVANASNVYTYNTSSSTKTYAYRPVQLAAGPYVIGFNWKCTGGEDGWDFGSVMVTAASEPLVGGTGAYFSSTTFPNYIKRCEISTDTQYFCLNSGWDSYVGSFTVTTPGVYNIAVMWSNDGGDGTANYPLAIDNIGILPVYTLTVSSNDTTMGTVTGSDTYMYGTNATITATPAPHHHLVSWSDGNTDMVRTIVLTSDSNLVATFAIDQFAVNAVANDTTMGSVTGSGLYNYGATATLTATANPGHFFVSWNDGDTHAVRTIVVNAAANYTATFAVDPCYSITMPYSENFNSYSGNATSSSAPSGYPNITLPNCWTITGMSATTSTYPQAFLTSYTSYAVSGNALFFKSSSSTSVYAVLPDFGVNPSALMIDFAYRTETTSTSAPQITVGYTTNPDSASAFVALNTYARTTTLTSERFYFPANIPAGSRIAFRIGGATSNNYYASIDNVVVDSIPSCIEPSSAVFSNVAAHTATVSWSLVDTTEDNFVVAYGTGTNPDSMTTVNAATNSITLSGLTDNTPYNVFVKAVCSTTDQSNWSPMASFRTDVDCGNGFANRYAVIGNGTYSSYSYFAYATSSSSTSYAKGLSAFIYTADELQSLNLYDSNLLHGVKVLPTGTGSMNMTIFVANTSKSVINSTTDTFTYANMTQVFNGTASFSAGQWAPLMFDQPFSYNADSNIAIVFRRNSPATAAIPVYYTSTSPNYRGYYDYAAATAAFGTCTRTYSRPNVGFVFCTEVPACAPVNTVVTSNVAATTVDVAWQLDDTTQHSFTVAYGVGTNPDSMATVNAATNSASISGLNPATTYHIFVKANCNDTTSSAWSRMVTFTTTAIPATVPYVCGFEDSTDNASWLTIAGSGVNHFMVGTDTNAVRSGSNALYVANASNAYSYSNNSSTKTYAYRPVQLAAGSYAIGFDWKCTGGESTYDFGSVMITSADEPLVGGTGASYSSTTFPSYITRCQPANKNFFNLTAGWNAYNGTFTVTTPGIYNIAVMWSNDGSVGTANYPLAVDNFSIRNAYALTVAANVDSLGTVTGSGIYVEGDTATITATPASGCRFVSWNDGDTHRVRSVVVTSVVTYTATFAAANQYALVAAANDNAMGSVTGSGLYTSGDTATLTAVANARYHFVSWNDNDTHAVRTVIVTSDTAFTATFAINQYTVTVVANDTMMGTVTGTGLYNEGDTATLTAVANTGYHFVSWNDGDTNATRTVIVTAAASFTATFAVNQYTVTVASNNVAMGTVTGSGIYNYNSNATLTATANTGYHFVSWNDGDTNASRTVVVVSDTAFTATFAINQYTLSVAANDTLMGTVTGAGVYNHGDTAALAATANTGYHFVSWNDGDTNASRSIVVTADASFTATFAANQYTITAVANDTTMGTVTGAGVYDYNSVATLAAVANTGYHFVSWNDGDTSATRSFVVTADASFTATFEQNPVDSAVVILSVNDTLMGQVLVNGQIADLYQGLMGDTVVVEAVANEGFRFVAWSDGDTNAVRTLVLDQAELLLTATFEAVQTGIRDVESANYVIYSTGNRIMVRGAEQQPVYVFDVVGRLVAKTNAAAVEQSFTISHTGIYLVKVANCAAQRVVVR